MAKDVLFGRTFRDSYKNINGKSSHLAYCKECDEHWNQNQLIEEKFDPQTTSMPMLKFTIALMFLSVMVFLVGILLLIFSLWLGALVIGGSFLLFFVTTLLYKR
jgi:hypothetical protein